MGTTLEFNLLIENTSDYYLCDIVLNHLMPSGNLFTKSICINPHSSMEVSYYDYIDHPVTEKIEIANIVVKDNNWHYESTNSQLINPYDKSMDSTSMITKTNLGDFNALGSTENNMTIVLIPYLVKSNSLSIEIKKQFEIRIIPSEYKAKKSISFLVNVEIRNLGMHIYNDVIRFELSSPDLSVVNEDFELKNLLFNEVRDINIKINASGKSKGIQQGKISAILGNYKFEYDFNYEIRGNKLIFL